jgi:nicotinamide mononucleotide (NMN) deamidase PncC
MTESETKSLQKWLQLVSDLSLSNVESGTGGPFAAVVIRNGELMQKGQIAY